MFSCEPSDLEIGLENCELFTSSEPSDDEVETALAALDIVNVPIPLTKNVVKEFNKQYRHEGRKFQIYYPEKGFDDDSPRDVVSGVEFFCTKLPYRTKGEPSSWKWKPQLIAPGTSGAFLFEEWYCFTFLPLLHDDDHHRCNINSYRIGKPFRNSLGKISWSYDGEVKDDEYSHHHFFLDNPNALGIGVLPGVHRNKSKISPVASVFAGCNDDNVRAWRDKTFIEEILPMGFKRVHGISIAVPIEFDRLSLAQALISNYVTSSEEYEVFNKLYKINKLLTGS